MKGWDCDDCYDRQRRRQYLCTRRGTYDPDEAMRRLNDSHDSPLMPLARYDRAGVCPYSVIGDVPAVVARCRTWWEHGSLGMSLMDTPLWLIEGMEVYGAALQDAIAWQARQESGGTR